MRQLQRVTRYQRSLAWLLLLTLAGCGLPGPYQTYSPEAVAPRTPNPNALSVYGATTTTPENEISSEEEFGTPATPVVAETAPDTPAPDASSPATPSRVAICYSRLWSSADAVHSAAVQACGKAAPRLVSQNTDLDACPTLTPTHAVYRCGP